MPLKLLRNAFGISQKDFLCLKKLFFQVDNGPSQSQNDLNGSLVISNHRVWPQKGPILSLNRVKIKPLLFRRLWTEAQLELFGVLSLTVVGPRLCWSCDQEVEGSNLVGHLAFFLLLPSFLL